MENIVYPEMYKSFLDVLNILNVELWVLSAGCMTYVDFHIRFLTVTIGPIVAMLVQGRTYFYAVRRHNASVEALKVVVKSICRWLSSYYYSCIQAPAP